jgi:hypothetical protein
MSSMICRFALVILGCAALQAEAATTTVLYDGSAAGTPQTQGWLTYAAAFGNATSTTAGGKTVLDTTPGAAINPALANAEAAGYSNYFANSTLVNGAFPTLDPAVGFTLSFDMKLDTEVHATNDRAGFDVLLLGSDNKGIELGFWSSPAEVWAQEGGTTNLFTHAESSSGFDPTVPLHNGDSFNQYNLAIQGGVYTLTADGTTVLTGSVRDYSAAPNDLAHAAYHLNNFVFLGDDTTSARGAAEFDQISITVPEPGLLWPILGIGLLAKRRRR